MGLLLFAIPGAGPGPNPTFRLAVGSGGRHAATRAAHATGHPDDHPATASGLSSPTRAAAPGALLLLAAAAAANWPATIYAVTVQPNWPAIDHPTPWIALGFLSEPRSGRRGPRQAALPSWRPAGVHWPATVQVPRRTDSSRVEPGNARAGPVVGRRGPGHVPGVRVGDGRLLPVAGAGGGAHHGVEELAAPGGGLPHRGGAYRRLGAGPGGGPWIWWASMVAGLGLTLFLAQVPQRGRGAPQHAVITHDQGKDRRSVMKQRANLPRWARWAVPAGTVAVAGGVAGRIGDPGGPGGAVAAVAHTSAAARRAGRENLGAAADRDGAGNGVARAARAAVNGGPGLAVVTAHRLAHDQGLGIQIRRTTGSRYRRA